MIPKPRDLAQENSFGMATRDIPDPTNGVYVHIVVRSSLSFSLIFTFYHNIISIIRELSKMLDINRTQVKARESTNVSCVYY